MSTAGRKQAPRLARPAARYWKGKAPKGVDAAALEGDSDDEEEEEQPPQDAGDIALSGDVAFAEDDEEDGDDEQLARGPLAPRKGMNVTLRDVNISKDGKVIVAGREESGRTAAEAEEEYSEEEEDTKPRVGNEPSEDESSEEESEPEDEQPAVHFRPVFVPKRARVTVAEKEAAAQDTEEAARRKEAEAEERKQQSHEMVAESIRRELAEKEKEENVPDVDDADGLDPEAEFEAWRLRELGRIKREKEDEVRREEEREEIERRRALPEEQRIREDTERADKLRAEKPKGQQKFLQKYWHKGAFHQDADILKRHDYTEATESTVDISMLPKVMQVKNFGKRSRTKYTHLLDQDTTQGSGGFGATGSVQSGGASTASGGCFLCGGPHMKKDCPQNQELPPGQRATTGTNNIGMGGGSSKWGDSRPPPPRRDMDDRGSGGDHSDFGRDRGRREQDHHESRSSWKHDDRVRDGGRGDDWRRRSRSPLGSDRRRDENFRRRSRSRSRSRDGDRRRNDDKRRRVD